MMWQHATLRVRSSRGVDVACATKFKRPFKKRARKASFLKLSEELQTRYGLPQFPSCLPEDADVECGNGRNEIDSLIRLLPPTMQQVLLQHEHKTEVRLARVWRHEGQGLSDFAKVLRACCTMRASSEQVSHPEVDTSARRWTGLNASPL